ncbi:hypothetical protein JTB14_036671 [Gonioctena quinquepunctata]|nr:hypothetical protein JTB14_036671 [Gonioctena quinquepunctata]
MNAHRLSRDELEYELEVRGAANTESITVTNLRKLLRDELKSETLGELKTDHEYKPDISQDIDICRKKVTDLENLLSSDSDIETNSNEQKTIDSKLQHLYRRLARLNVGGTPEDKKAN